MASTAISYGTELWLADLQRNGWTLTVSERLQPVLTIEGGFESLRFGEAVQVGVLPKRVEDGHEGSGVFVPCVDRDAAWRLLERVEAEGEA